MAELCRQGGYFRKLLPTDRFRAGFDRFNSLSDYYRQYYPTARSQNWSAERPISKSFQISSLIGFIAVLISGLFLHSLADSALAYSLAIIIGLADNISINRLKNVEG